MNKTKKIIGVCLILAIAIMAVIAVKNKDTLFKQIIEIRFPDGCVEGYINGKLVTPVCESGRQMELDEESYDYGRVFPWQKNITVN